MGIKGLTGYLVHTKSCGEVIPLPSRGTAIVVDFMSFMFSIAAVRLSSSPKNDARELWLYGGSKFTVDTMMAADFDRALVLSRMIVGLLRHFGVECEFILNGSRGSGSVEERRARHAATTTRTEGNQQSLVDACAELEARETLGSKAGEARLTNADQSMPSKHGLPPTTGLKDALIHLVANELGCVYMSTCGEADRVVGEALRMRAAAVDSMFAGSPKLLGVLSNDSDFAVVAGSKLIMCSEFFSEIAPILSNVVILPDGSFDWTKTLSITQFEVPTIRAYSPELLASSLGIPKSRLVDLTLLLGNDFTKERDSFQLPGRGHAAMKAASVIRTTKSINDIRWLNMQDPKVLQSVRDTIRCYSYEETTDAPSLDLEEYAHECRRVYQQLGPTAIGSIDDGETALRRLIIRGILPPIFGAACPPQPKSDLPTSPDPVENAIRHGGFWIASQFFGCNMWNSSFLDWRRNLWQVVVDYGEGQVSQTVVEFFHDDKTKKLKPTVVELNVPNLPTMRDVLKDRPLSVRMEEVDSFLNPILGVPAVTFGITAVDQFWVRWMQCASGFGGFNLAADELKALIMTSAIAAGVANQQSFRSRAFPITNVEKIEKIKSKLNQKSVDIWRALRVLFFDFSTNGDLSSALAPVGSRPLLLIEWILMTHRYLQWTFSLLMFSNRSDSTINDASWVCNISHLFCGLLYFLILVVTSTPESVEIVGTSHVLMRTSSGLTIVVSQMLHKQIPTLRSTFREVEEDCADVISIFTKSK